MIILTLITCAIVVFDQFVKNMMLGILPNTGVIPVIKGFFSLTLVFNKGAAFGIMADKPGIFFILPGLTIVVLIILFLRAKNKKELILPFGLLMGGTLGNFIDRLTYGHVVDFFDMYYKNWHWPAFNIADYSICSGVILLLLHLTHQKSDN